jgi:PBSX family phage terminase large subunit
MNPRAVLHSGSPICSRISKWKNKEVQHITQKTNKFELTKKQKECVAWLLSGRFRRINILEGSVRSGKTYVSMVLWWLMVTSSAADAQFLMTGNTLMSLKRNLLEPMLLMLGCKEFSYSLAKKEAHIGGKRIYLEGAGDARGENKIRGLTLDGAYCDELSLMDEEFFTMLLSRLSRPGAKLIATTNPDGPGHWLKRRYLDNKNLDLLDIKFSLDDNTFLDPSYTDNLKREYTGVFYDRYILGLWTAAEGRVYEDFNRSCVKTDEQMTAFIKEHPLQLVTVGVDYGGNKSATVFCLTGFDRGFRNICVLDEYYDSKNRNAEHLIQQFAIITEKWHAAYPQLRTVYCDSAEQLLVKSFRQATLLEVKNALKKPINSRIAASNRLIASNRLHIAAGCEKLITAFETAVWDDGKTGDSRLDNGTSNIDSLDAFEYATEAFEREIFRL